MPAQELSRFKSAFSRSMDAVHRDISNVRKVMGQIQSENYELHSSLTTLIAARAVLNSQRKEVDHLHHEGMLEKNEADKIQARAQMLMKRLMRNPPMVQIPDLASLLRSVGYVAALSEEQQARVLRACVACELQPRQVLLRKGEQRDEVFIVRHGTLCQRCLLYTSPSPRDS